MKTAILADIHSNLTALEAVLLDIEKQGGADRYWCLGDIVDYGPDPHECLERIRELEGLTIVGNHDWAVAGKMDTSAFRDSIAVITHWTQKQLSAEEIDYLKNLPQVLTCDDFTLVHGSPRDPIWEYILTEFDARVNLTHFQTRVCLVGHTHVPLCFHFPERPDMTAGLNPAEESQQSHTGWDRLVNENRCRERFIQLDHDFFIINPGSVGQPRDGDPRAAYAVYNSGDNTLELRRVEYDVAATQRRMKNHALPEWFSQRLGEGV